MTKLMKTLMLVGTLMVATTTVTAQETQEDLCKSAGNIAALIMDNRQLGTTLSDMMVIAGNDELVKMLVLAAYDVPRFSTDEYKERATQDFRNEVELVCYAAKDQ